jgi:D-serine deaminase-like pyridoxal phosphate-dependent protein
MSRRCGHVENTLTEGAGLHPSDIPTPAALIDEARLMRNIARMQQRMNALGVRLRPHVKTTKCIEVARRQRDAGAVGITVSTLKEAEQFFAAGFSDVLYAVCIPPAKLDRALALRRQGCALTILVDSIASASAVVAKGKAERHPFDVMIEVDSDGHRSGVRAEDPSLIDIGSVLHDGGAVLKGVMTHAGSSYDLDTPEALQRLAEQERRE